MRKNFGASKQSLKSCISRRIPRSYSLTERTLFFDFLPLSLGDIKGFKIRFHLYTVPGQVFYAASRKLILKGVDGVILVADSRLERMESDTIIFRAAVKFYNEGKGLSRLS